MKINNLQVNRNILEYSNLKLFLEKENYNSKILISNFGFVIIPKDKNQKIKKYYIKKEYYDKEIENYIFLKGKIIIPKINIVGSEIILGSKLYLIELENIRVYKSRFTNIMDINSKDIGNLLSELHLITFDNGKAYLHGNLHQSNFFVNNKGELGIFDFVGMLYGRIEYDFMIIYVNSSFNDNFLKNILNNYKYKNYFNFNIFYKYVLKRLITDIKLKRIYNEEGIKGLRKALFKIRIKLGNLT